MSRHSCASFPHLPRCTRRNPRSVITPSHYNPAGRLPLVKPLCLAVLLAWSCSALALPQGGQVVQGNGSMGYAQNGLIINQITPRMAINWNSFDIGINEAVAFHQPVGGVALNRVLSNQGSAILGRLQATGQLFVTNPNGIVFGPRAEVNVGGLVASTGSISNEDFAAGNYRFLGNGARVEILNQGRLTAQERGYVALLAPQVINQGVISARLGSAILAAGEDVTLSFDGNGLLNYRIDRGTFDALVSNRELVVAGGMITGGLIKADGGRIFMGARAAEQIGGAVVNNEGVAEALNVQSQAGVIRLMSDMHQGSVNGNGRLDASAPNGGDGGFIETSAAHVDIGSHAVIRAGATYGAAGTWLIDPTDYLLNFNSVTQDGTAKPVLEALKSTDVTITTAGPGNQRGVITVDGRLAWGNWHTLTLIADTDIVLTPNTVMSMERQNDFGLELTYGNLVLRAGNGGSGKGTLIMGEGAFITRGNWGNAGIPGDYGKVTLYYTSNDFSAPEIFGPDRILAKTFIPWLLVSTPEQLQAMGGSAAALKLNYALARNIDATVTRTWNQGAGFNPIGNRGTPFTGIFDGQNHVISNLYINRPASTEGVGLFGRTQGSTIRNVGLVNANVTGGLDATGALVGLFNGSMSDAWVSGLPENNYAGSSVTGSGLGLTHQYGAAATGGLVGSNTGSMVRTYSDASVNGVQQVGGLVGKNLGRIEQSYATGAVAGDVNVGGFAGGNETGGNGTASLSNVYSSGSVSGNANVGGLVGENSADVSNAYSYSDSVQVTTTGNAGGLIGQHHGGILSGALFWNITSSGRQNGCGCAQALGTGLTGTDILTGLHGLDPAIWRNYDGYTAPLLRAFLKPLTASFRNDIVTYDGRYLSAAPYITLTGDSNAELGRNVFAGHLDEALNQDGSYSRVRNANQTHVFKPQLYSNQKGYDIQAPVDGKIEIYVNPRSIVITPTPAGKSYDGTTASPASPVSDYLGEGDKLVASQSYDNPNANPDKGNGREPRTLAVDAGFRILFNGEDVTNNYLVTRKTVSTAQDGRVVIDPAKVAFMPVSTDKTYDTSDSATTVKQNLFGGDYVQGLQSYASANAGTWRLQFKNGFTVMRNGVAIDPSNYDIQIGDAEGNVVGTINPKDLHAHAVPDLDKIYDGTRDSSGKVVYNAADLLGNHQVKSARQAFLSENASPKAELAVSELIVDDGNGGSNYRFVNDAPGPVYGNIAKALLRLTSTLTDAELAGRYYDGTTIANGKVKVDGLFTSHGDSVDLGVRLSSADAGKRQVLIDYQVNDGTRDANGKGGNNYAVVTDFASLQILPRPTTITGGFDSKPYDRNTISKGKPQAGNAAPEQTLVANQRFADVNAAPSVATLVNDGFYFIDKEGNRIDAGNYAIRPQDILPGSGSITAREVTARAQGLTKDYDGNTSSRLNALVDGVIEGDDVTVAQEFDQRDYGARKLTPTTLTEPGGHQNYVITQRVTHDGFINQRELTINANPYSKTYDGNTSAAGFNTGGKGTVGGDELLATAVFQTADAVDQKIVVSDGYYVRDALTGTRSDNYRITTSNAAGSIAQKQLDVTAIDLARKADGIPFSGGNGVRYNGFVNGEDSSVLSGVLGYGGTSQGAVAPGRYTITPGGLQARNYRINNIDGTLLIDGASIPGNPGTPGNPSTPVTSLPLSQVVGIAQLDMAGQDLSGLGPQAFDRLADGRNRQRDRTDEDERLAIDIARRNLDLRVVDQGMRLPAGLVSQ